MWKLVFLATILSISVLLCSAQTGGELGGGKDLYNKISASANHNLDSLDKIGGTGALFVSFEIADKKIVKVRFSTGAPLKLIKLFKGVFEESSVDFGSRSSGKKFILPVFYDYGKGSLSATAMLEKIPAINLDSLPAPDFSNDFDVFMERADNKGKVVPVECYFLPWIKLGGKIQ